jgi:hypothetical protein
MWEASHLYLKVTGPLATMSSWKAVGSTEPATSQVPFALRGNVATAEAL